MSDLQQVNAIFDGGRILTSVRAEHCVPTEGKGQSYGKRIALIGVVSGSYARTKVIGQTVYMVPSRTPRPAVGDNSGTIRHINYWSDGKNAIKQVAEALGIPHLSFFHNIIDCFNMRMYKYGYIF